MHTPDQIMTGSACKKKMCGACVSFEMFELQLLTVSSCVNLVGVFAPKNGNYEYGYIVTITL